MAGILVPDVGAILLTAAAAARTGSRRISSDWPCSRRRCSCPAILGGVTLLLFDPEDRPKGRELLVQVARGYALVPILAVTLVVLAVAGTLRKLDSLAHRREDAHVPIVVRPGRYDALVAALEDTLRADGLVEGRRAGSAVLTTPARLLARVAGRGIGSLVPDRLIELHGPGLKLAIYPSDLALTGEKDDVARARALVARDVPSRDAWFTTSKEAQKVEDRLAALESADPATRAAMLAEIDRDLLNLTIDQDTFEVLYRRRLQLAVSPEADVHDDAEPRPSPPEPASPPRGRPSLGSVVGLVVAVLTAIDLALVALRDRLPRAQGALGAEDDGASPGKRPPGAIVRAGGVRNLQVVSGRRWHHGDGRSAH